MIGDEEAGFRAQSGDFTESAYAEILDLAKSRYRFVGYRNRPQARHVVWRHDVDCSMHRALRMAMLESAAGVQSTYFLYPRSLFYNLLSRPIVDLVASIAELGHEFGLHFDPTYYRKPLTRPDVIDRVAAETKILQGELGVRFQAVSFHLFGVLEHPMPEDDELAGLVNAYGTTFRSRYDYVSDSNGVWRFRPLREVIEAAQSERLQVLTHPVWWTPEPMAPRARVQRCIEGYAKAMGDDFDEIVAQSGRPNVR